jgi:hypothetical protein
MKRVTFIMAALLCCVSLAQAQSDTQSYPGNLHNRGESRILLWDGAAGKAVAEAAVSYGRPEWKDQYGAPGALDQMTKGKVWRAGKNFWSFLDTNVPLNFGGQEIPVGMYYLVVKRSADGNDWTLSFVDPDDIRSKRMDASEADARSAELSILYSAPLTFKARNDTTRLLEMELMGYPNDVSKAIFAIRWGKFELSVPVEATL